MDHSLPGGTVVYAMDLSEDDGRVDHSEEGDQDLGVPSGEDGVAPLRVVNHHAPVNLKYLNVVGFCVGNRLTC